MSPVKIRVMEILDMLAVPSAGRPILETADLVRDLGFDTVDMARLCHELVTSFDIAALDADAVLGCETAGDVVALARRAVLHRIGSAA